MPTIQEQIDALNTAIGSGVKSIAYSDRTVTYHSLAEMLEALARLEALASSGTEGRSTFAAPRRD